MILDLFGAFKCTFSLLSVVPVLFALFSSQQLRILLYPTRLLNVSKAFGALGSCIRPVLWGYEQSFRQPRPFLPPLGFHLGCFGPS
jgi:hypothetical protein